MTALPPTGRPVPEVLADLAALRSGDLRPDRATSYHFESGRP
jgi:hypothetical protein